MILFFYLLNLSLVKFILYFFCLNLLSLDQILICLT